MRPGQNNNSNNNNNNKNRSRGRNNNGGRKHLNPLSRNYESNGPDVKVRGNAAHVAEKYVQLARDAHTSGDSVMAENYLQHAEHYFRILSAAQPQPQRLDQFGQEMEPEESDDDFAGDDQTDRFEMPVFRQPQQNDRPQQNGQQNDRPPQQQGERQQSGGYDRNNNNGNGNGNRDDRPPRFEQQDRQPRFEQPRFEPVRSEAPVPPIEASAVLPGGEASEPALESQQADAGPPDADAPRRLRERRPRRRRPQGGDAGPVDPDGPQPEVGELPAFITAGGNNPAE